MTAPKAQAVAEVPPRFSIRGKIYDSHDVERLSLRLCIELQTQTAEVGRQLTAGAVEEMAARLNKLPVAERKKDPDAMWLTVVTIWASMRSAGDEISFSEVLDIPSSEIKMVPTTSDRKTPDPTKPRPTRKASGRAAKPRATARRSSAKTSSRASTRG